MSRLLQRPRAAGEGGLIQRVTPQGAGWGHVGFEVYRLQPGQTVGGGTGHREVCLVLVSGRAAIEAGDNHWAEVGERMSPFQGKPFAVYVPAGQSWAAVAQTELELAVCSAPGGGSFEPRLITPGEVAYTERGTGTNVRHVFDILPETAPAHSLLVVEVITPAGHWSSYPPHKHDTDALPAESALEETYYHRLHPPQGFAFQRVYSDDRALDETMTVHDRDVVLVPRGYHPVGAAHGYDLYYLNVMAGPKRIWRFRTEPAHQWLVR
jgi:5-deoxy-glucuronate isomerase